MRYYFNLVRADETISDQVGIELADLAAQFLEPIIFESLAELRKENGKVNRWRGWMLEVRDASNNVVFVIDLDAFDGLTLLAVALGGPDILSIFQDLLTFS